MGLLCLSLRDQGAQQGWLMRASVPLLRWLNTSALKLLCNKTENTNTISYVLTAQGLLRIHVLEERLWTSAFREGSGWVPPTELSWESGIWSVAFKSRICPPSARGLARQECWFPMLCAPSVGCFVLTWRHYVSVGLVIPKAFIRWAQKMKIFFLHFIWPINSSSLCAF